MISVVIPNYNRADLLRCCLGSLRAQTYRDMEVVVVDNGSTDGSAEMVVKEFPEVVLRRMETNTGFSAAVNEGIGSAQGGLVALLNNDAEADPAWLAELHEAALAHPEAGFFASKMLFYSRRDTIDTVYDCFTVAGFGYKKGWGEKDHGQYDTPGYVFGACGGAAMYRKEMLEAIKEDGRCFDESYFAFGEDLDISFRAQSRGYKCLAVPSARVFHRVRATAGRSSSMPIFLGNRNTMTTVFKNFPASVIRRHIISLVSYWLLAVFVDFLKTGGFTVLRAYMEAIRNRRGTAVKRRAIQSAMTITAAEFDALLDRGWLGIWWRTGMGSARVRKETP